MNMDYSKAFELINQGSEEERNEKAEKAVHDNLYNKGYRDGIAVLNKARAEIEYTYLNLTYKENSYLKASWGLRKALEIIDKNKAEIKSESEKK